MTTVEAHSARRDCGFIGFGPGKRFGRLLRNRWTSQKANDFRVRVGKEGLF